MQVRLVMVLFHTSEVMRENGEIFCNIVMATSRVAPLKFMSVPRLELTAAALAKKIAVQLREELDMEVQ